MTGFPINPPRSAMVNADLTVTSDWYRFFANIQKKIGGAGGVWGDATGATALVLQYNSDGTIKTNETPKLASYYLRSDGGAAYTTGVTWAVSTVSGSWSGTAPSISGTGTGILSINSGLASSEAIINISATYARRTYPPLAVKVTKSVAEVASGGGGGGSLASDTSLSTISSSSFAAISDSLVATTGSSSTSVTLTAAALELWPVGTYVGTLTWNIEMKWQRETAPSVWTDVAAAVNSIPDPGFIASIPDPGEITCNTSATGLASSTAYTFRLVAKRTTGTQSTNVNGTASAQG